MKDAPAIVDPAGWAEIFCAALASEQHRAAPGGPFNLAPHLRQFDDLFPWRRKWSTRLPAFHSQNAPTAFLLRAQIVIQTPGDGCAIYNPSCGLSGRPGRPTA
jgi:hypothetical protein